MVCVCLPIKEAVGGKPVRRSHLQENPFPLWFFVLDDIGCVKIENVELKRFRIVKEVGTIVMNVRIFAYYQLMQVCQAEYFRQLLKPVT
uniref:Uncharacterized protein n=1 Tax=Oryza meridionalis TaxID=40149 RepID=A0A0E0C4X6_9ORYZ